MITKPGIQYCKHCDEMTHHRPKMDAVKNGQQVCTECSCCNYYIEMTKEALLPLMQKDRPIQQILEVIDFRPSDRGIEGELYIATVRMRSVRYDLDGVDKWEGIAEDMPYPLGPAKEIHDAKIDKMMDNFMKENGHRFEDNDD